MSAPPATSSTPPPAGRVCPKCGASYEAGLSSCPVDGTSLADGPPAAGQGMVGEVLADRYRIVRKLGEGGMGEVFEAAHIYIDKRFAIKTLRREITGNPDAVARFHQEARAASTIGHENIVGVDDFGRLPDGGVYLAMEYLEGCSLAERMRRPPPLSYQEGVGYLIQACHGLAAAHEKGILHRDVKPDNVFLARKGDRVVVKILDFGIAKVLGGAAGPSRLTQTGAVFGTPYYMSPEQALGKATDARSDVYAVGVMLYELAVGHVPFEGDSFMGILSQHITTPPKPPRQVAPQRGIPESLERVILRAMAKEPGERQQSMAEVASELEAIAAEWGGLDSVMPTVASGRASAPTAGRAPSVPLRPLGGVSAASPPTGTAASVVAPVAIAEELDEAIVPAGANRGRVALVVLGLVLVLGASAAAYVALGGRRGAGDDDRARKDSRTNRTTAPTTPPATPAQNPSPTGTTTAQPTSPASEMRPVYVQTTPSGARILDADGERLLGSSPGVVEVPVGHPRVVTLQKDGLPPRLVTLDAHTPSVNIVLEHTGRPHPHDPGTTLVPLPPPPPIPTTPTPTPTPVTSPVPPALGAPTTPRTPQRPVSPPAVVPPPSLEPIAPPSTPRRPTVRPSTVEDPYEALPPPTRKPPPVQRPPAGTPPVGAPLDPY